MGPSLVVIMYYRGQFFGFGLLSQLATEGCNRCPRGYLAGLQGIPPRCLRPRGYIKGIARGTGEGRRGDLDGVRIRIRVRVRVMVRVIDRGVIDACLRRPMLAH